MSVTSSHDRTRPARIDQIELDSSNSCCKHEVDSAEQRPKHDRDADHHDRQILASSPGPASVTFFISATVSRTTACVI